MKVRFATDPQRILLIKPSSLGDVTHAIPILLLLRKRFPAAHIAWLVAPYCAGLIRGLPQLDEVILFDRKRFGAAWRNVAIAKALVAFHRDLRAGRFDLVLDLQGLLRSAWLTRATGAPVRVGFDRAREGAPLFYTHRVRVGTPEQHAIDRYLTLAESVGCARGPVEFAFPDSDEHRAHVDRLLPPNERIAVLMPGTNWLTKRWPAEHFAALVAPLKDRGLTPVIAGGPDAVALAPDIPGALNLAGQTDLPQLVALLRRADLVIANDSGPMHIAAALGRPLVTMFGPTNHVRTGPYRRHASVVRLDIACAPCYSKKCSHISCLRHLAPADVMAVAESQTSKSERQNKVKMQISNRHP